MGSGSQKRTRVDASMDCRVIGLLAAVQSAAAPNAQQNPANGCRPASSGEIVVCGTPRAESPYRLPKLPDTYEPKPVRAETDVIPGVHTRAHVESERMLDGNVSKRLMVTFTVPF
jgi:hypothetical protein